MHSRMNQLIGSQMRQIAQNADTITCALINPPASLPHREINRMDITRSSIVLDVEQSFFLKTLILHPLSWKICMKMCKPKYNVLFDFGAAQMYIAFHCCCAVFYHDDVNLNSGFFDPHVYI